jgi:hypothetical protein
MSSGKATARMVVRSFGSGTVSLAIAGLPAGVTASLSTTSLISGDVTFTFSSASTAVKQTVPITIWASSGARVHYMTFNLNVA